MCEHWWDERLLREQAETLRQRKTTPPVSVPEPPKPDKPERRSQNQPDPVPL